MPFPEYPPAPKVEAPLDRLITLLVPGFGRSRSVHSPSTLVRIPPSSPSAEVVETTLLRDMAALAKPIHFSRSSPGGPTPRLAILPVLWQTCYSCVLT
jgi:hypothetical protein